MRFLKGKIVKLRDRLLATRFGQWADKQYSKMPWVEPRATPQAVAIALQQFSLMLKSGVASAEALDILARQTTDPIVKDAFEQISDDVIRRGWSLSVAFKRHPRVFSQTVVMLIRAAEESSNLAERLERAGQLLERNCRLQNQVKGSLISPAITTLACTSNLFAIVRFILPKFLDLYESMGVSLPLVSQFVIGVVHLINSPFFLVVAIAVVAFIYTRWNILREKLFEKSLKWRLTRNFVGSLLAVEFVDIVATTLRDGIPIQRAMDLLSSTAPYRLHAEQMSLVGERVRSHGCLSEAVEDVPYFPKIISSMLMVGEESGHMDELLVAARGLLEEQNALFTAQIVSLIEPVVIACMGVSMGVICVGMFLPIYGLLNHLGG